MIRIMKAFRDALVADATLTALVPAANIYAGLRDEKTPIPAVDVFQVSEVSTKLAGARIGGMTDGMTDASVVMQVSVFATTEAAAWTIADRIQTIVLGDNETLNTAKIKNLTMIGSSSMREANVIHIPLRFRLNYHYTIT